MLRKDMPVEERVNTAELDSLLRAELYRHRLAGLTYEYRLCGSPQHLQLASYGFVPGEDAAYTTQLFPNSLAAGSGMLMLHFPGRDQYLNRSLFSVVLLSS